MESISVLREQLAELSTLEKDWDSYGAEPPNAIAIENTRKVLDRMEHHNLEASRVLPDACNGAGVVWVGTFDKNRYADIACGNDGSVVALTSDQSKILSEPSSMRMWYVSDMHVDDGQCDEPSPSPGDLVLTLEETLEQIRYFIWVDYNA